MRDFAMTLQVWRSVIVRVDQAMERVDQALKEVGEAAADREGDNRDRDS